MNHFLTSSEKLHVRVSHAIHNTTAGAAFSVLCIERLKAPALYYSAPRLRENILHLEEIHEKEPRIKFAYAVKACCLYPVVAEVAKSRLMVEVQSPHEIHQANRSGIASDRLLWNGPRKNKRDLKEAFCKRITVIVDSISEGEDVIRLHSDGMPLCNQQIGIRISLPRIGGYFSNHTGKLGMSLDETVNLLRLFRRRGIAPYFFHCHALARVNNVVEYGNYLSVIIETLHGIFSATGHRFPIVDLGGGFDSRTRLATSGIDIEAFVDLARYRILDCEATLGVTDLIFEPGRYLVEDAAFGLCTVIRRKLRNGHQWLIVDLSTNLIVPLPLARFGVLVTSEANCMPTSIADGTCTPAGVIVADFLYPSVEEGEIIVFTDCGAYSAALAKPFFEPPAPIYWLDADRAKPVVSPSAAQEATDLFQAFL